MSHEPSSGSRTSVSRGSVMDVRPRPRSIAAPESVTGSPDTNPSVEPEESQTDYLSMVEKDVQESEGSPAESGQMESSSQSPDQKNGTSFAEDKVVALRPELLAEAVAQVNKQEQEKQEALESSSKNKKKRPVLAIVIAVLTALSLVGVTTYAYLASRGKSQSATPNQQQKNQEAQENMPNASVTSEIEKAESDTDAVINSTDDAQEVPDTGINEQSIGF